MKILKRFEDVQKLEPFWDKALLNYGPHTIFQTWGWNYYWLKFFQEDKNIYIMLDSNFKSLAPFYQRKWGELQILDLIGTRGSDYLDIICPAKNYFDFFCKILKHFLDSGFDIINLEDVQENSAKEDLMRKAISSCNLYSQEINWCTSSSVDLSNEVEERTKSKLLRLHRSRKRRLCQDYGEYLIVDGHIDDLDAHYALHQKRFQSTWSGGTYSTDIAKNFMTQFSSYLFDKNMLHYKILLLNGSHVASILGGRLNSQVYIYTGAFDTTFNKHSLGKFLYVEDIIESKIKGVKKYDLMRGDEKYKKDLGCRSSQNRKIVIGRDKKVVERYLSYYKKFAEGFNFGPSIF